MYTSTHFSWGNTYEQNLVDIRTVSPKQVSSYSPGHFTLIPSIPPVDLPDLSSASLQWPSTGDSRFLCLVWQSRAAILTLLLPPLWAQGPHLSAEGPTGLVSKERALFPKGTHDYSCRLRAPLMALQDCLLFLKDPLPIGQGLWSSCFCP